MRRKKIIQILELTAILLAVVSLVLFPQESVNAAKDGLKLCGNAIIPSLFPFFVLSGMIVECGAAEILGKALEKVMRPLFNVGGQCVTAFALGFVGGYPIGATTVISLYENGSCTKTEAERLLAFCNNSGPAFIFGVVGAGVFGSGKIGLLLYLAHTAASIMIGIGFRFYKRGPKRGAGNSGGRLPGNSKRSATFSAAFAKSVKSASLSTVNICGFVIFFTIFIKLLFVSGAIPWLSDALAAILAPLGMTDQWGERLLTGFIEISSGVWTLKGAEGNISSAVAMAAFMLGWAGISVHTQVLSFIGESGLSVRTYIAGKVLQGIISAGIIFVMSRLFVTSVPASVILAEQVQVFSEMTFAKTLFISFGSAFLLFLLVVAAVWIAFKRDMKKLGIS